MDGLKSCRLCINSPVCHHKGGWKKVSSETVTEGGGGGIGGLTCWEVLQTWRLVHSVCYGVISHPLQIQTFARLEPIFQLECVTVTSQHHQIICKISTASNAQLFDLIIALLSFSS